MGALNRCAFGIRPRQPMLAWIRNLDPTSASLDLDDGACEPTLYLIPEGDSEAGTDKLLDSCFAAIFEQELESWCLDRTAWPEPRTLRLFRDWFELTFYDLVEDLADEELCDESASLIDQQQTLDVRQPSERQPLRLVQGFGGS